MDNKIIVIENKIDKILKMQELILSRLNLPDPFAEQIVKNNKKPTKKELLRLEFGRNFNMYLTNKNWIKNKFNLAATPQMNRVLAYLKSNNPEALDGLKRN